MERTESDPNNRKNPLKEFVETMLSGSCSEPKKKEGINKGGIIGLNINYQTAEEKERAKAAILSKFPETKILEESETEIQVYATLTGIAMKDSEEFGREYNSWIKW